MTLETVKKVGRGMADYVKDYITDNAITADALIGTASFYEIADQAVKGNVPAVLVYATLTFLSIELASTSIGIDKKVYRQMYGR